MFVRDWMRRHPVVSYFVIAYAFSWSIWIPMAMANARIEMGQAWPSHMPGLLGPILAACVMSRLVGGPAGLRDLLSRMIRWRTGARWYLAAMSPIAFYVAALLILAASGGQGWPAAAGLGTFSGLPVMAFPLMWLVLVAAAYAEETGWRGFAAHELLKSRSFLWTALVVGLLWALWHVPSMFIVENYRQMDISIVPMFTLGIICGSILLTWLYRASNGSMVIVALWHGNYNLVSGTAAAGELPAAVVSTAVMVWAVAIVVAELRKVRGNRPLAQAAAAG